MKLIYLVIFNEIILIDIDLKQAFLYFFVNIYTRFSFPFPFQSYEK